MNLYFICCCANYWQQREVLSAKEKRTQRRNCNFLFWFIATDFHLDIKVKYQAIGVASIAEKECGFMSAWCGEKMRF